LSGGNPIAKSSQKAGKSKLGHYRYFRILGSITTLVLTVEVGHPWIGRFLILGIQAAMCGWFLTQQTLGKQMEATRKTER
jgi:hypothetical protein